LSLATVSLLSQSRLCLRNRGVLPAGQAVAITVGAFPTVGFYRPKEPTVRKTLTVATRSTPEESWDSPVDLDCFLRIHPFANGNGRTAWLWANCLAARYGLPPLIRLRPRPNYGYQDAGAQAMLGDWKPTATVFRRLLAAFLDEIQIVSHRPGRVGSETPFSSSAILSSCCHSCASGLAKLALGLPGSRLREVDMLLTGSHLIRIRQVIPRLVKSLRNTADLGSRSARRLLVCEEARSRQSCRVRIQYILLY